MSGKAFVATKVHAVSLALTDGNHAVLVRVGDDWNGLRKFVCVSPPALRDETLIAAQDPGVSTVGALFGDLFNLGEKERWIAVMASPHLSAMVKRVPVDPPSPCQA